jgi:hypothetical protein
MIRHTLALVAAIAILGACGSDSDGSTPVATEPPVTTPAATDPPTGVDLPADLTSAEVCALVDVATVESAIGASDVEAVPGDFGTPQCSYNYQAADGTFTNMVTTVQRAEGDLGGRVGEAAFDYAVELNEMFAGDAEFVAVDGVGDQATFAAGQLALLIGQVGPRVITVVGSALDQQGAAAIGAALAGAVAALD